MHLRLLQSQNWYSPLWVLYYTIAVCLSSFIFTSNVSSNLNKYWVLYRKHQTRPALNKTENVMLHRSHYIFSIVSLNVLFAAHQFSLQLELQILFRSSLNPHHSCSCRHHVNFPIKTIVWIIPSHTSQHLYEFLLGEWWPAFNFFGFAGIFVHYTEEDFPLVVSVLMLSFPSSFRCLSISFPCTFFSDSVLLAGTGNLFL